jgi:hypothetical protein
VDGPCTRTISVCKALGRGIHDIGMFRKKVAYSLTDKIISPLDLSRPHTVTWYNGTPEEGGEAGITPGHRDSRKDTH